MKDRQIFSGKDAEMTDDQRECYQLFCDLVYGEHHICGKVWARGFGLKWNSTNLTGKLSTYDFNHLTRLVVMAHDRCIRVEVDALAPRIIEIIAFKRHKREGCMTERHPTIQEAIMQIRNES